VISFKKGDPTKKTPYLAARFARSRWTSRRFSSKEETSPIRVRGVIAVKQKKKGNYCANVQERSTE
jgi:hypothetical protein